jgi:hypothetical protein
MRALKIRNSVALIFIATISACATSSYRVTGRASYRTEIQVTSDRILLECEDIKDHENAGDPEGNFGFMIHVLDEEDTVLTLIQEPVVGRKDCFKRLEDIAKILKSGRSIYIGGHGTLDHQPREKGAQSFSSFPKRGVFYDNGRVLQFSVIKNEQGHCYSASNGTDDPCMPTEFPIKNRPSKVPSK